MFVVVWNYVVKLWCFDRKIGVMFFDLGVCDEYGMEFIENLFLLLKKFDDEDEEEELDDGDSGEVLMELIISMFVVFFFVVLVYLCL